MPRGAIHKLASNIVKTAEAGLFADGGGLFLTVKPRSKSWSFRFTSPATGRRREKGLGNADDLPLAAARRKAAELRELVAQGVDPLGEPDPPKHGAGRAITFGQVFDEFYAANAPAWRNPKHQMQWRNSIGTHAAALIGMPLAEIDTSAVLGCLSPIWVSKRETARRVRGRIEAVLDYAVAHGYREPGPNPANAGVIRQGLPKSRQIKTNFAAVAVADAPEVFRMIWQRRGEGQGAAALALQILGGFRPGEIRGLRWDEVQADLIAIPPERMKAGRLHRVPVIPPMRELLERERLAETVFFGSGGKPLSDNTLSACHKRIGVAATTHGWRSTFREWSAEAGWSRDLAELSLAHSLAKTTVESAYLRNTDLLDQRRPLLEAWARFLLGDGYEWP